MKKIIVILYSEAKREFFPTYEQYKTEEEVFIRSKQIKKIFDSMGFMTILLPGNFNSIKKLQKINPFVIFNLVDSVSGDESLASTIPSALELINVPYTGAGTLGLSVNADKYLTKSILNKSNIPVPRFQLFNDAGESLNKSIKFPVIVKLNEAHGSLEINQEAVVENKNSLKKRINFLMNKYNQPVLVEEYIRGNEITVLMIDGKKEKIILAEQRLFLKKEKYQLYSYEAAWGEKEIYDVKPYNLNKNLTNDIIKAFSLLQFRDYGRFEIMIDKKGRYYFIDPNVNPSFGPYGTTAGPFGYLLHVNNIPFEKVSRLIIKNARDRLHK